MIIMISYNYVGSYCINVLVSLTFMTLTCSSLKSYLPCVTIIHFTVNLHVREAPLK